MKKIKNDIIEPDTKASYKTLGFMKLKSIVFMLILSLSSASSMAQTMCPGGGWENEPIQDPDGCCILFDMLPSTLDFPWAYWFVVADGETYNNSDYPTGDFEVCYEDAGMENVVVTYVDAFGVTLCENDWTVFVEKGCGPDIICEDCIDFTGITVETEDLCTFDFEMIYTINPDCGGITIVSESWEYGYFGGHGSGATDSHTFPGDDTYSVVAIIEYTVDATGETCKQEQTVDVNVTGCSPGGVDCTPFELISATDGEMTIGLTTKDPCTSPTYEINITEFGSGVPLSPATYTTTEVSPDVWEATITGLDPCTPYQIEAVLLCDGVIVGACTNGTAWETDCPTFPCSAGCLTIDDIVIEKIDGCDYTLSVDYDMTDACGDLEIESIDWDFGFGGPGSIGEGEEVDVTFLCDEPQTVKVTITYTTYSGHECKKTFSELINPFGCEEECTSCLLDECLRVSRILATPNEHNPCKYELFFDWSSSISCNSFSDISVDWTILDDMGAIIGTTSGELVNYTFPGDGTYTVKGVFNYTVDEMKKSCDILIEIDVVGCGEKEGHKRGQFSGDSGKTLTGDAIKASTVPNPADENVTITIVDPTNSSDFDELQLEIFDINGREVYRGNTRLGAQKMIDVSHFESGLYIYEVRDGETVLLKEKLLIK